MPSPDMPAHKNIIDRIMALSAPARRSYDGWVAVGTQEAECDFVNGWGNVGDPYPPLSFHLSDEGKVYIRGAIEGGLAGTVVFTLPEYGRPEYSEIFIVAAVGGGYVQIQIDPSGDVTFLG